MENNFIFFVLVSVFCAYIRYKILVLKPEKLYKFTGRYSSITWKTKWKILRILSSLLLVISLIFIFIGFNKMNLTSDQITKILKYDELQVIFEHFKF